MVAEEDLQTGPDREYPQHRFLEGHSLLTQSEGAEPEKYFHTKATLPEPSSGVGGLHEAYDCSIDPACA